MSPGGLTSVAAGCGGLDDESLAGAFDVDGAGLVDGAEPVDDPAELAFGGPDALPLQPVRAAVAATSKATAGAAVLPVTCVLTNVLSVLVPLLQACLQR
jgi:hypothetical protein